jgi:hypothetical protein
MRYTLWSRGRLLGETDLGVVSREHGSRCGWLHPTPLGERLLPAATGVAPAVRTEHIIGPDATARAEVLSAVDREQALELELHGPDGAVIEAEDIRITDTHYLRSIVETELDDESVRGAEEDTDVGTLFDDDNSPKEISEPDLPISQLRPAEETELPRYQIQLRLVDPDSIP